MLKPIIVKGKKPKQPLEFALEQLKKTDLEIGVKYLYLSVGPRKALRDKWYEMEAEIERLRAEKQAFEEAHDWAADSWMAALNRNARLGNTLDARNAVTLAKLIECDKLLSEVTECP